MTEIDLDRLEQLEEGLALLFYFLMFVALIAALAGSAGSAFLVLVLGSCAHVGRASVAELVDRERARKPRRVALPAPTSSSRQGARDVPGRAAASARTKVRLGG